MTEDAQLLDRYALDNSEAAFAEFTRRHVNLVYSAALRLVHGDDASAQDLTQQVFTELARQAKHLARHPALVGWLYTTTRLMALRANRTEQRRRSREQEAFIMNELLRDDAPPPDWSQISPVLEDAMHELDEKDQHMILLRFFQNKSLQEAGAELNLSENAARMRVARALDRLGEKLKRRGITTTAAALGAAVSAHAVQSAPGVLAGVVSSAAVAGGAVPASHLLASYQTILMTTTQKAIVAAALAVAAGTGLYAVHQHSKSAEQIQTLERGQAPLNARVAQLQNERDQAAQQLAALREENARLKSNETELARLRGKVGTLRNQIAANADASGPSSGLAKLMSDPAMKEYIRQAQLEKMRSMYADLFQELKMTPDQTGKFLEIMTDAAGKGLASYMATGQGTPGRASTGSSPDVQSQLRQLLGDDGYTRFNSYSDEIPARTVVSMFSAVTADSPLSDEQKAGLMQIIKAEPLDLTMGFTGAPDKAFLGSQDDIDGFLQQLDQSNQRILQQAGSLLNSEQLATLNSVLTNGVNTRRLQAVALLQKH
jgi:RNA polymerase sigma factor (sigma-70 family)